MKTNAHICLVGAIAAILVLLLICHTEQAIGTAITGIVALLCAWSEVNSMRGKEQELKYEIDQLRSLIADFSRDRRRMIRAESRLKELGEE